MKLLEPDRTFWSLWQRLQTSAEGYRSCQIAIEPLATFQNLSNSLMKLLEPDRSFWSLWQRFQTLAESSRIFQIFIEPLATIQNLSDL